MRWGGGAPQTDKWKRYWQHARVRLCVCVRVFVRDACLCVSMRYPWQRPRMAVVVAMQRAKDHELFKPIKHKSEQKSELSANVCECHFECLSIEWRVDALHTRVNLRRLCRGRRFVFATTHIHGSASHGMLPGTGCRPYSDASQTPTAHEVLICSLFLLFPAAKRIIS